MDPQLIIFAIESAIRLGNKINQVLIDKTAERPIVLPLGELIADVSEVKALEWIAREGRALVAAGGPWHPYRANDAKLVTLYRTMHGLEGLETMLNPGLDATERRQELAKQIAALEQFRDEDKSKSAARRVFGTLVEIGIDYATTFPGALGRETPGRKVLTAFVSGLKDTDFAEGNGRAVLSDLFRSALDNLGGAVALVNDRERLSALLGGITSAIQADMKAAFDHGNDLSRAQLFRRVAGSLIRGGAAAFTEHIDLFIANDAKTLPLVKGTLTQILDGLRGQENLFTGESVEIIFQSALRVVAENPGLIAGDQNVLQDLVGRILGVVGDTAWGSLFTKATAASVLYEALEVFREQCETLIGPDGPRKQLLATALAAMAGSLSENLAGGGGIEDILSRRQLLELSRSIFLSVAEHPDQLLAGPGNDPRKTVLAQVIASVAKALGQKPTLLINGAGFVELVRIVVPVVAQNVDQLIDTKTLKPETNLLFKILEQLVTASLADGAPHRLISRTTFISIVERALPIVSANLELLLDDQPELVRETVEAALDLADDALQHRINGANLPILVAELFRLVLWEQLDLTEKNALKTAAETILKLA